MISRLSEYVDLVEMNEKNDKMVNWLSNCFEDQDIRGLAEDATKFVKSKYANRDRPYFKKLRSKLLEGLKYKVAWGLKEEKDIGLIESNLSYPDSPLLEKVNILQFYQDWFSKKDLMKSSEVIMDSCKRFSEGAGSKRHDSILEHFKNDLIAQLFRECDQKQKYLGIETFIKMSSGIPRNLLVLLKHITAWSLFYGEQPFRKEPISVKAQQSGIFEASDWFYRDARAVGENGGLIQASTERLATLFKAIRFSDKPVECSCISFSCDISQTSAEAQRVIDFSQKWSLLIDVGGQKDRNSERVDVKLQLNPMLSPRWSLPINRRGTIALRPEEINSIFDNSEKARFNNFLKDRVARMSAPFFGKKQPKQKGSPNSSKQLRLPY